MTRAVLLLILAAGCESGPSEVVDPSDRFELRFEYSEVGPESADRAAWRAGETVLSIQRADLDRAHRRLGLEELGQILSRRHEVEASGAHAFYECSLQDADALCGSGHLELEGEQWHRRDVLVRESEERLLWVTVTGRSSREVEARFARLEETFEWKS